MFVLTPVYRQFTLQDYATEFYMSQKDAEAIDESKSAYFYNHVTKVFLAHPELFEPMYPKLGRPAVPPAVLQAAEIYSRDKKLSDRALCNALRTNSDIRRALGIEGCFDGATIHPFSRDALMSYRKRVRRYEAKTGIRI